MTAIDHQRQAAALLAREAPAESIIALAGLFAELCAVFHGPGKDTKPFSRAAFDAMAARHGLVIPAMPVGSYQFTSLGHTVYCIGSKRGMREVIL